MIDTAGITVRAGNGGNGIVAFRREKHVPRGGPSGGDGGRGGAVILVADAGLNTLQHFRHKQEHRAESGGHGGQNRRHGRDGQDLELRVPVGTQVWLHGADGVLLGDLDRPGGRLVVAEAGRGGHGNARYVSSVNQEPRLAEAGEEGAVRKLSLELKLLADVGIIGMPNAGKSTLLSVLTAARPKVADYPFTTIEPALGVVERGLKSFVMVDIPGLIEGAHAGVGLGDEFLRHIERTAILVHLLDGSEPDPAERMMTVNEEMRLFDDRLARKRQVIVVNKADLSEVHERRSEIARSLASVAPDGGEPLFISAAARQGLDPLVSRLTNMLEEARAALSEEPEMPEDLPVLRPRPRGRTDGVMTEDGAFRIIQPRAVRLARGSNLDDWAARLQFHHELSKLGVLDQLTELGVESGDTVLVGDWELEWE